LLHFGIKSTLVIRFRQARPLIGALTFNDMKKTNALDGRTRESASIVAQIFANAITRKRADRVLRESEERLRLATAASGLGVWVWMFRATRSGTENWRRMFGFPPDVPSV